MPGPTHPSDSAAEAQIDRLCDEFEQGWRGGQPIPLEAVVASAPAALQHDLFRELVAMEREYREQSGRPLLIDEARTRFAGLGAWVDEVLESHFNTTMHWDRRASDSDLPQGKAPPDPWPESIGGYKVVQLLGQGGMGAVFLADDPLGRRQVAVKIMLPRFATNSTAAERFLHEARAAMAIESDYVVPIYQVGLDGAMPFLVMPVLKGESLKVRLKRSPHVPIGVLLRIAREMAMGLEAVHRKGMIHRDVKPANVWLQGDPRSDNSSIQVTRTKLLDFGLSRASDAASGLTLEGSIVGTPGYMAPEQAAGEAVDARADLFSLGAVLYEMASGRPAFTGNTISTILARIATHHPPAPMQVKDSVPAALSRLIMNLLEKDPAHRPATAREVINELESIQDDGDSNRPRFKSWVAGVLAALLMLAGIGIWRALRSNEPNGAEPTVSHPALQQPERQQPKAPATPIVYRGSVDLYVKRTDSDGSPVIYGLSDPRAWPLRPGDYVKVIADIEPEAFVYLFWISETGKTFPIYPWTPLSWTGRPMPEQKASHLEIKGPDNNWFRIDGDQAGMETLQMIVRSEPLNASDDEIQGWFKGLRPLTFAGEKARAWFEGFDLVKHDTTRSPVYGGDMGQEDDPLGMQSLLGRRIGKQAEFSRAVSFSRLGKKDK